MDDNEPAEVELKIAQVCSTLESIANSCPADSIEFAALKEAAMAFQVVHQRNSTLKSFRQMLDISNGHLSDDLEANLKKMGFEPDEFVEFLKDD